MIFIFNNFSDFDYRRACPPLHFSEVESAYSTVAKWLRAC